MKKNGRKIAVVVTVLFCLSALSGPVWAAGSTTGTDPAPSETINAVTLGKTTSRPASLSLIHISAAKTGKGKGKRSRHRLGVSDLREDHRH